jgi:hypothetical protein
MAYYLGDNMDSFYTFIYERINKKESEQPQLYIEEDLQEYYDENTSECDDNIRQIIIIDLF